MNARREALAFSIALGGLVALLLGESLFLGKVLSPADVLHAQASFRGDRPADYEPSNRLLIDPVLQFQPWLEFNRRMLRSGRLPLWNSRAGLGVPHLANGQSAVFDPFFVVAYLGKLPDALAWIAAARLWVAGFGMYLLGRRWGLGVWGRWFAGLAFPLCGFMVLWLQYTVASAAAWLPWCLWATDRAFDGRRGRDVSILGLVVAASLAGGHVQTTAHVLIASGLYALTRAREVRGLRCWAIGIALGVAIAAVEVVPLGFYLAKSPVWADRAASKPSAWSVPAPRLLDAACTALPYLYGSQRRGMPNLARALGVHNLNESAGGFAGLATLLWLAPIGAMSGGRWRWLATFGAVGLLGAFGVPPVANLLRAVPVVGVTDNRRLTLWVAFALVLLGGRGLDQIMETCKHRWFGRWVVAWLALAVVLVMTSAAVVALGPRLRERALSHERAASASSHVARALRFTPRYLAVEAAQLASLAALALGLRRGRIGASTARAAVAAIALADLMLFAHGVNPATDRIDQSPRSDVIDRLRQIAPFPARAVGVGAELPPNTLMRFGLADCRNYDSIELTRSLDWLEPLYGPGASRTSRRPVSWTGVARAIDRLRASGVAAAVGATEPPPGMFGRVERVGDAWIADLGGPRPPSYGPGDGRFEVDLPACSTPSQLVIPETFDHGWRAWLDGVERPVAAERDALLRVDLLPSSTKRHMSVRYDPAEVRWSLGASATGMALAILGLVATKKGVSGVGGPAGGGLESNLRPTIERPSRVPH